MAKILGEYMRRVGVFGSKGPALCLGGLVALLFLSSNAHARALDEFSSLWREWGQKSVFSFPVGSPGHLVFDESDLAAQLDPKGVVLYLGSDPVRDLHLNKPSAVRNLHIITICPDPFDTANLKELETLFLAPPLEISWAAPVSKLATLKALRCSFSLSDLDGTETQALDFLSRLPTLEVLQADGVYDGRVEPLAKLVALRRLGICLRRDCNVSDIRLPPKLERVSIEYKGGAAQALLQAISKCEQCSDVRLCLSNLAGPIDWSVLTSMPSLRRLSICWSTGDHEAWGAYSADSARKILSLLPKSVECLEIGATLTIDLIVEHVSKLGLSALKCGVLNPAAVVALAGISHLRTLATEVLEAGDFQVEEFKSSGLENLCIIGEGVTAKLMQFLASKCPLADLEVRGRGTMEDLRWLDELASRGLLRVLRTVVKIVNDSFADKVAKLPKLERIWLVGETYEMGAFRRILGKTSIVHFESWNKFKADQADDLLKAAAERARGPSPMLYLYIELEEQINTANVAELVKDWTTGIVAIDGRWGADESGRREVARKNRRVLAGDLRCANHRLSQFP